MPFGWIFGALFFGVVCGALGLRWMTETAGIARVAAALFATLGGSLALGLILRRRWARWAGAAVALGLAVVGLRLVAAEGGIAHHLLVFAALVTSVLLVVPATGDPRRAERGPVGENTDRVGAPGWIALASVAGLVAVGLVADPGPGTTERAAGLPAAARFRSVDWNEFGPALVRAQAESRPILATFVTDWCPYCSRMSRETWRDAAVGERLADLIPVKVDAEGSRPSGGFTGRQLAERYGVSGYPAQLLLDAEGRVIARNDGFQGPRELLSWIDSALGSSAETIR